MKLVVNARAVMAASGVKAVHTALALGHRLVPILGKSRVEVNDPDQYARSLLEAVLSKWTLPDTVREFGGLDEGPPR